MEFQTDEKNARGEPLIEGLYVDVGKEYEKEEPITRAIRGMQDRDPNFKAPFLVMDLALPEDVKLSESSEAKYAGDDADDSAVSDDYELNPCVKLLVPCSQIVDLSKSSGVAGSTKVAKCNQMIPAFRWFQAANLLLHHQDLPGRVIPFPLDHDEGTTYHMLPVSRHEFGLYQQILEFGTTNQGVEKGFATAAKFSYELLAKRGITELKADQVDALLAHVMVGHNGDRCKGILLDRASRSDLEDLQESHFVFY